MTVYDTVCCRTEHSGQICTRQPNSFTLPPSIYPSSYGQTRSATMALPDARAMRKSSLNINPSHRSDTPSLSL